MLYYSEKYYSKLDRKWLECSWLFNVLDKSSILNISLKCKSPLSTLLDFKNSIIINCVRVGFFYYLISEIVDSPSIILLVL